MEITGWPQPYRSKMLVRYPKIMRACCGTCANSTWRGDGNFTSLPLDCKLFEQPTLHVYGDYWCDDYQPIIDIGVYKP